MKLASARNWWNNNKKTENDKRLETRKKKDEQDLQKFLNDWKEYNEDAGNW